jgi:class 3 adenylate cyclase
MSPATLYGNIVKTVEAMFGLILLAVSVRIRISGTSLFGRREGRRSARPPRVSG